MDSNGGGHDGSTIRSSAKQPSATKRVAIPSIPDLVKHHRASRTAALSSPSTLPPPSPARTSPGTQNNSNQGDTHNDLLNEARRSPSAFSAPREPAVKRKDLNFDVYAKPYIPSWLQVVNEEAPGNILVTETKHQIRFESFISSFAGKDFLSRQSALGRVWSDGEFAPATELTAKSYLQFFASLLERECAAKTYENKKYALYKVLLQEVPVPDGHRLWALSVPGLREDSPLIEMGDTLEVRQLWVDWNGNPIQMPYTFATGGKSRAAYDCWTGKQYVASVHSVSRVNETVYLRIDGLTHLIPYYDHNVLPMIVNVVFPLKQSILQGQHKALLWIGQNLERSSRGQREVLAAFEGSFGPSPSPNPKPLQPPSQSFLTDNDWVCRMLFPIENYGRLQTQLRNVPHRALFDHTINYEQAHAVSSVCNVDYGTLPYLISGPPGTGKTKTLVEVAMQLLNTTEVVHVLICAPSEAAADTLAVRLGQHLTPKQLLRLNGPNRADNEVPRELLQYCYMQDNMFYLPPFKALMSFNVVVTSCRDAAILAEARLTNADLWTMERDLVSALHPEEAPTSPSLHWGALLLDEAAQATEIDALSAISIISPPAPYPQGRVQPRLIMAGDEHQLGPRTASHDPAVSTSLFARLFSRPIYANHPLSRSNVKPSSGPPILKKSMLPILYPPFANLIRNYRSHPAILNVPSSHFYHDTLIPEALLADTPLQNSPLWRGRKWPVLYIPHTGPDEIERDNGGWYNISEARLACSIAERLVLESDVKQEDICIMSPFAAQVKLLRSMIRKQPYAGGSGLWEVNIGPVEAFQGLEKRVVVLCTTRTRSRFVVDDVQRSMGLMQQKRKMNVALTRAKEALFVIGSPEVMGADVHWRAWMAFCERNGLVDDPMGVWRDRNEYGDGKVGVLERALVAKEDGMREKQWPALGAAVAKYDVDEGEYEAWTESLRRALDEEEAGEEEEGEEEQGEEEQEEDSRET